MPAPFAQSTRALQADGFRRSWWGGLGMGLALVAGLSWFFLATIAVYEATGDGRLEVDSSVHPVEAASAGRVLASHLELGRMVRSGDVLVELESEGERLLLEEEKARLAAFTLRREVVGRQIALEEAAWPEERLTARLATDESRARLREIEAMARFAEAESLRMKSLDSGGLLSRSESQRADEESVKQRASAAAQVLAVSRGESEARSLESDQQLRRARLQREAAVLDGELATAAATLRRREFDLEHRRIRAPVGGLLGEVAELQIGGFLGEGRRVAAIIPAGGLRAVAYFPSATGLGRLRPGQDARLRLDGFPWAQYGSLGAVVAKVANEPLEGRLRVELALRTNATTRVPLQHGFSASVEVEVDRISPARLVLRAAGGRLSAAVQPSPNRSDVNRRER